MVSTPCSCLLFVGRGLAWLVPVTMFAPCSKSAKVLALRSPAVPQPAAGTVSTVLPGPIVVPCEAGDRAIGAAMLMVLLSSVETNTWSCSDPLSLKSTCGTYGVLAGLRLATFL